ncbi:dehydrogenase [Capnocytophaga sp. G2]|uniref:dehydrogenase n=1 Tax=Capnocytophaga sp. G2 TaxID=3110695 RepID=UPI002B469520|nr:dehydrogenase [Capnocytophaga sp. G2]MEB3005589.1 dehydrogenase [Capnocytophaga sp. G2]
MTNYHTLNTFNNPFRHYRVIDIVPFQEKIAVLQFASADVSKKMVKNGVYVDRYILVDIFSEDFTSQKRLSFFFEEGEPCYRSDAYYYGEGERLFILIEYYKLGNIFVTNKVFEITENEVIEQPFCCIPQKRIFNDTKVYSFGDKEVFMQSPFMMSCRDKQNQKTLWKYKLSAYLYTQVEEYNDILYFGTAGKGGYFYGVSLNNGQTVFSYNTGQTVHFVRNGERIIISDKKQKPILMNALTGEIIYSLDISKYTIDYEQQMLWYKDYFYTIARNKEKDVLVVCVDI